MAVQEDIPPRSVNTAGSVPKWQPMHVVLLTGVTVIGAVPRTLRLSATKGFAWDESYYVPAARAYLHGDYSPNFEHPPLAKWAIAAGIKLVGDQPAGWRMAALVAGIATIPLTWLLVRHLLASAWWATFAALLVATDGMLIVNSRTALLDSLLPPLVVGAALCVTLHLDRGSPGRLSAWSLGAGALLGAAMAVKWETGAAMLAVLAAFAITGRRSRRALVSAAVAFALTPALVYLASYAGHFAGGLSPGGFLRLQRSMLDYHRDFRIDHPSDSSPVTWLWLQRPVSYGSVTGKDRIAITMALGNPALWWSFLASLPVLLVCWWRGRDRTVELVLFAWASLHLVWLVILRPGFLYYLTPLVPFMAVGVTWTSRWVTSRWRLGRLVPIVIGTAAIVALVAFMPIWTYEEISLSHFHRLMLFGGWEP